jgi:hypothetical protein
MAYTGHERRPETECTSRATPNTNIRRDICVAVRDRETGKMADLAHALNRRICGGLRFNENGVIPNSGLPQIGNPCISKGSGP